MENKKEQYEELQIEVVEFESEDIIITSPTDGPWVP